MVIKKLKSKAGVSVAAGLLIFLVCVVLGGAVLAAATAAAGRLSRLADVDKRYYNVTSAAEVLAEELGNQTVIVTRYEEKEVTSWKDYSVEVTTDDNGHESTKSTFVPPSHESTVTTYKTQIGEGDLLTRTVTMADGADDPVGDPLTAPSPIEAIESILSAETAYLLFGTGTCNTPDAMDRPVNRPDQANAVQTTLSLDDLAVNANFKLRSDGVLVIELDDKADGQTDHYMLKLMLTPVIDDREKSESDPPVTSTSKGPETTHDGKTTYTLTTTVKTNAKRTRTTTVKWVVTSVEKPVKVAGTT